MRLDIRHACDDFTSYRAARVKSLFNVESGCNFELVVDLPIEAGDWQIGLIVGPSGSGESSLGAALWGKGAVYRPTWPKDAPIVEAIAPGASFEDVTGALASVGLGSVPAWLRPYQALSNGERFRADLARVLCETLGRVPEAESNDGETTRPGGEATRPGGEANAPRPKLRNRATCTKSQTVRPGVVIDEFTSVVDRQIAKVGALAFAKAWRRTGGQAVLLSCHYDIVEWLTPDWVLDTASGEFQWRRLRRRPSIDMELWETDWRYWPAFEPHHYLKLPRMIAATNYVATVAGDPVAHVAVSTRNGHREARACRLVVMPEWQGAGVGLRFLDAVCERWRCGENRYGKSMPTLFHTSHPGLAAALRRSPAWTQVSAKLYGESRARSVASINRSAERAGKPRSGQAGYGGHFRAVQGFRYLGV